MRPIDADALLEKIVNVPSKVTEETFYDKETDLLTGSAYRQNEIIDIVNDMPTVEQKHGHWIGEQRERWIYAKCSECGKVSDTSTPYCPYCGAKMEEVEE